MSKKNKVRVPEVELNICIPVYGNYKLLEICIKRIELAAKETTYNINIVDDGSPDLDTEGVAYYKSLIQNPKVRVTKRKENKGFPYSANEAISYGKSPYILLLNSDVFLDEDCIDILMSQLKANDDIGITFPKLMFPANSTDFAQSSIIQHAGMCFDINGVPYHIFGGWHKEHPFANRVKDFDICTGAVLCMKRQMWNKLGGFDLQYSPGYFEEIDFEVRARLAGWKIRYLPQATGTHVQGGSFGKKKDVPENLINRNLQIFKLKLGQYIPYNELLFCGF